LQKVEKEQETKEAVEKAAQGWLRPGTIRGHELDAHYEAVVSGEYY